MSERELKIELGMGDLPLRRRLDEMTEADREALARSLPPLADPFGLPTLRETLMRPPGKPAPARGPKVFTMTGEDGQRFKVTIERIP